MRILLVIDSYGAGGAQNQLSLLAQALAARGHEVQSFQYFEDDFFAARLHSSGVVRHVEPKRGKVGANVVVALRRLIGRERFDVVLSYMDTPNCYAALACRLSGRSPALVVSHRQATRMDALSSPVLALRRWVNRGAAAVVCNSHHERRAWQAEQPTLRIETIWNGIPDLLDGDDSSSRAPNRTDAVPEPCLGSDPILLAVGTVRPDKNALLIVDALALLETRGGPACRMVWLGKAKHNLAIDREYDAAVRDRIARAGLQDRWRWAGQHPEPVRFYRAATALVHAATVEGLPNVVCEAQTVGLPAVLSDVLDHPLMIENGVNGYRFDPTSAETLAAALERLLSLGAERMTSLRTRSRELALERYSIDRCADEYEALFADLVRDRAGGPI